MFQLFNILITLTQYIFWLAQPEAAQYFKFYLSIIEWIKLQLTVALFHRFCGDDVYTKACQNNTIGTSGKYILQ